MTDLDGLIRYRKHIVDEKQKVLSELYRQAEEVENAKSALLEQMEDEKQIAKSSQDKEASTYLLTYLEGVRHKIKNLDRMISQLDVRITAAREDVRLAFAEQKKIEIVQEERKQKEQQELKAKETQELDAIAIDGHRKKMLDQE